MAKLFVSCPMRGRTERQIHDTINQLCDIAEAIFNEKFEVIDTWIAENAPASNHNCGILENPFSLCRKQMPLSVSTMTRRSLPGAS